MPAAVADAVAPVGVLLVEICQARDPSGWPEPGLDVADRALDGALLARRGRRASRRVKRVVAPQRDKAAVPGDLVAVATRDDRAQIVVDALARDAAQPLQRPNMPFQERLGTEVEAEVRRLRARERQAGDQRVDAPLTGVCPMFCVRSG